MFKRTLQVRIIDLDFIKFNFESGKDINIFDLVEIVSLDYARKSLLECNEIALKTRLSDMNLDEINAEINAVRNAKNYS